ncbi:hypothetical protein SCP_1200100 [Sparassis crispa]|uniref:Ankyrin n=1 Tax=Sparassis crispa TaxID=139825 RepID=A0A401H029_9APHY|nr:hypothetical protein SCP_1200100 [Sparassis crispa]GBE87786.1 hypothetical protein SCP_1200100 [Sparassis crispa]
MATAGHTRYYAECTTLDHSSLVEAAARADEKAVRLAIDSGADVNTSDATGRTLISCTIGGESWEDADVSDASYMLQTRLRILKLLLNHHDISLYALNVPVRGVTPLGLAAWLNVPDIVHLLVEGSNGMVAVDGVDAHAATPLMYAARDGRREVVCHLLMHDARPDLRDMNHRSSIQYALPHSEIIGLCEVALRRHRARENTSRNKRNLAVLPEPFYSHLLACNTARLFDSVFSSPHSPRSNVGLSDALLCTVLSADLSALYPLLFPTHPSSTGSQAWRLPLINLPDAGGWSLIHHCVAAELPSVGVLDALYRAGADLSLYTASGHGTPLHCLAHKATPAQSDTQGSTLRSFIRHLVRDLGAPLSARDHNNDTCLHVASERGQSIDVLIALLSCDPNGRVRELRNSRGLTAVDVAKPEFRAVFGMDAEHLRCASSASACTIRPLSVPSLRSVSSLASISATLRSHSSSERNQMHDLPQPNSSVSSQSQGIFNNLQSVSLQLADASTLDVGACRQLLLQTSEMSDDLLAHLRSRIHDAADELRDARGIFKQVDGLLEDVTRNLEGVLGESLVAGSEMELGERARRRTTDSGDSEATAVSKDNVQLARKSRSMSDLKAEHVDAISPPDEWTASPFPAIVVFSSDDTPSAIADDSPFVDGEDKGFLKLVPPWVRDLPGMKSKSDVRASPVADQTSLTVLHSDRNDSTKSGAAKIKAWLRKKIKADVSYGGNDRALRPSVNIGHDKSAVQLSRSNSSVSSIDLAQPSAQGSHAAGISRETVVPMCRTCLNTASKDLSQIEGCMDNNREASLEYSRLTQLRNCPQDIGSSLPGSHLQSIEFPCTTTPTVSNDDQVQSTPSSSASSSVTSLSATLIDTDEDDTHALRRLLGRKIVARTDGAFEEIDKVVVWLRIVQSTLQDLKRRTSYLL